VLQSLTHETIQTGEWVNLIGYITPKPPSLDLSHQADEKRLVYVQALLIWPTGPLDIQKYEASTHVFDKSTGDGGEV
jgi:hypothetical protein